MSDLAIIKAWPIHARFSDDEDWVEIGRAASVTCRHGATFYVPTLRLFHSDAEALRAAAAYRASDCGGLCSDAACEAAQERANRPLGDIGTLAHGKGGRLAMKDYMINVSGCDDHTTIIVPLTEAELATVARIAMLINEASETGCQPTMSVKEDREAPS